MFATVQAGTPPTQRPKRPAGTPDRRGAGLEKVSRRVANQREADPCAAARDLCVLLNTYATDGAAYDWMEVRRCRALLGFQRVSRATLAGIGHCAI